MASFKNTFDGPGTSAQAVTTSPAGRVAGGLLKVTTVGLALALGCAATFPATPLVAPVAELVSLAAIYGLGAAYQANAKKETKASGETVSRGNKFLRHLNPFKF